MAHMKIEDGEPLYLGIDLGTSRSVVAGSNGIQDWVESYVGWPKDFVARKSLGRDVLFGGDALEHRLSLNLHRPLHDGVLRDGTEQDEQAVSALIGHLIAMGGATADKAPYVAVGVPAECLKVNKLAIRKAVGRHAQKLMVVSEPFAVAYGMGMLDNAMMIDIGAGTVDFCIMHGTVPREEDQRSLLSAGDAVDTYLFNLLSERIPEAGLTLNMARRFKESFAFVGSTQQPVEVRLPVKGKMVTYDITDEMRKSCELIMPPLIETTMDLIGAFDPEFQEKVRGNILLAGGGSQIRGLPEYLSRAMDAFEPCRFSCVTDPLFAGARGALELARDMPEEFLEQL